VSQVVEPYSRTHSLHYTVTFSAQTTDKQNNHALQCQLLGYKKEKKTLSKPTFTKG